MCPKIKTQQNNLINNLDKSIKNYINNLYKIKNNILYHFYRN